MESQGSRIKNGVSHNPECCEEGNRAFKPKINKNNVYTVLGRAEDAIKIATMKGVHQHPGSGLPACSGG